MQKLTILTPGSKKYSQLFLLLILALTFITPVYAADEEEAEGEAVDNTEYYELSPPFVVNLKTDESRMRFLQVRIQILGSPDAITAVTKHNAPLRDIIITGLSSQTRESINTPKKKKALQVKIQKEVETLLEELTGVAQIEGLYFTNFVIQ